MLKLERKHIKTMTKAGKCDGNEVNMLKTYGGLYVVAMMDGQEAKILSFASHEGIAKYQADKNSKKPIKWYE